MSSKEEYKSQKSQDFKGTINVDQSLKVKMDFPFDLNNLFNLSYSFDTLR
jgi:hypothetical protein